MMTKSGQLSFTVKTYIDDEGGKYIDNKSYEKDKKRFTKLLKKHINDTESLGVLDSLDILNLLKQSKWSGTDNDSVAIRPIPVVKDKRGKLIKDYDLTDWLIAISEKYKEITDEIILEDNSRAAEELQDLKHVCTTMQHWLGFDDKAIDELCNETNAKNQRRGYFRRSNYYETPC